MWMLSGICTQFAKLSFPEIRPSEDAPKMLEGKNFDAFGNKSLSQAFLTHMTES